jgi:ribose transport system ATP-binding protein
MSTDEIRPLLEIENVNKQYPGVKALDNVSLSINAGEVMALLGENGAGKSTLVKVLSGAICRDSGDIKIDGQAFPIKNTPISARNFGVAIIYQELSLLSQMSVAENIYLTHEPTIACSIIDYKAMHKAAYQQLEKLNATGISTKQKVESLPLPEQQMVEIAKALAVNCKVIIMDEPTTSLTSTETERLFDVIRTLKKQGVTVIYISHRMDDIFQIADSATVMRDGKVVGKLNITETNSDEIVEMMTGKFLEHKRRNQGDCKVQYLDDKIVMCVKDATDGKSIKGASFDVYEHEVLGFAGLVGAKRTELARMLFGADKLKGGEIYFDGIKVINKSPAQAIKNKLGYLSEDRKEEGLNLGMTLKENTVLIDMKPVSRFGFLNHDSVGKIFENYKTSIRIKGFADAMVSSLSGGNQQKVAIAKWLHSGCNILIFDEPTRGIDVAAKAEIYMLIRKYADEHKAAIVISSDVAELVDVCDRVLVMANGAITMEISSDEISQEKILKSVVRKGGQ